MCNNQKEENYIDPIYFYESLTVEVERRGGGAISSA
jgi:hypothetical protein